MSEKREKRERGRMGNGGSLGPIFGFWESKMPNFGAVLRPSWPQPRQRRSGLRRQLQGDGNRDDIKKAVAALLLLAGEQQGTQEDTGDGICGQ